MTYRVAYVPDARKKHRRAHDKTSKCEEKRGSKEHRKSKGSAGHRREWSPDDPNDASAPPPNLSDGTKKKQLRIPLFYFHSKCSICVRSCDVVKNQHFCICSDSRKMKKQEKHKRKKMYDSSLTVEGTASPLWSY